MVNYMSKAKIATMIAKNATPSTKAAATIMLLRISPEASG